MAGLSHGPRGSCVVSTGRSAAVPESVVIPVSGGPIIRAVIPRGWRASWDERERNRRDILKADSGVDGPGSGAVVPGRELKLLVSVVVDASVRLAMPVGSSAMVGKLQRRSSKRDVEVSILVGLDVSASSRPHLKANA